jgi:hypothetical protein
MKTTLPMIIAALALMACGESSKPPIWRKRQIPLRCRPSPSKFPRGPVSGR